RQSLLSAVEELRSVLADLSQEKLSNYGLAVALESNVERFSDVTGIEAQFLNSLDRRLPGDIELLTYRLAQEALANIRKHSHARNVRISLELADATLHLTVSDNGRGFNVEELLSSCEDGKRLGLRSMRQRAQAVK